LYGIDANCPKSAYKKTSVQGGTTGGWEGENDPDKTQPIGGTMSPKTEITKGGNSPGVPWVAEGKTRKFKQVPGKKPQKTIRKKNGGGGKRGGRKSDSRSTLFWEPAKGLRQKKTRTKMGKTRGKKGGGGGGGEKTNGEKKKCCPRNQTHETKKRRGKKHGWDGTGGVPIGHSRCGANGTMS